MAAVYLLLGLLVVCGGVFGYGVLIYNGLVKQRNQVDNAWSQIDVQLKRRHDLIPNLVETAKGYMQHEQETLGRVTEARNLARDARSVKETGKAEGELSSALGQFFMVSENYPNLKADQHFLSLHEEITSTENKIGFARQFYNDSVMQYNNSCQTVPNNFVAGVGHFTLKEFFEIEKQSEREAPKVAFS